MTKTTTPIKCKCICHMEEFASHITVANMCEHCDFIPINLCKSCNTMKHLNSDGLCGRCATPINCKCACHLPDYSKCNDLNGCPEPHICDHCQPDPTIKSELREFRDELELLIGEEFIEPACKGNYGYTQSKLALDKLLQLIQKHDEELLEKIIARCKNERDIHLENNTDFVESINQVINELIDMRAQTPQKEEK